ncbi:hypothetical protein [Parabacteroides sp. Marseille-P3160]|uniref:hypothetical protein n=1 Tax=Parabacteroides sp. Marseille-P3160 TaxID=1917887 RepID=UPI0009BAF046|nr:hypothetical protein [Parabacteroides sp. Marseille-P3160]
MGKKICIIHKWASSNLVKYLRDLSIVIVGVFITLWVTNIISDRTKQNEVNRVMVLVKTELEENLQSIKWAQQKWETEQRIYSLVRRNINHIDKIPADTLEIYKKVIGDKHSLALKNDSYEVFKSSLLMQYIKDKDFLRELSKIYGYLELISSKLNNYSNLKGAGINHMMNNIDKRSIDTWASGSIYDYYTIPLKDNVFRTFVYTGGTLISSDEFDACEKEIISIINRINEKGVDFSND